MYHFTGSGGGPAPTQRSQSYPSASHYYGNGALPPSQQPPQQYYDWTAQNYGQQPYAPQFAQQQLHTQPGQLVGYYPPYQEQQPQYNPQIQPQSVPVNHSALVYPPQQYYAPSPQPAYAPPSTNSIASSMQTSYGQQNSGPQSAPVPGGSASQTPEPCYNCGLPGHWAQNCPEPRRVVPAGDLSRPKKRQRTFEPAKNSQSLNNFHTHPQLNRGWTHPLPNQHSQNAVAPWTPVSVTPPSVSQWPSSNSTTWPVHPQTQKRNSTSIATPSSAYPSQHSSPVSTREVSTADTFSANTTQLSPPPANDLSQAASIQSPDEIFPVHRDEHSNLLENYNLRSLDQGEKQEQEPDHIKTTTDEDDIIQQLHDLDESETKARHSPPPQEVTQPLRLIAGKTDAADSDSGVYSDGLASDSPESRCLFKNDSSNLSILIAQRDDWEELQKDPIFASIPAKCESVSFEELAARRKAVSKDAKPSSKDDDSLAESHLDGASSYLEEPLTKSVTNVAGLSDEQEERLAALGVTGPAKPSRDLSRGANEFDTKQLS